MILPKAEGRWRRQNGQTCQYLGIADFVSWDLLLSVHPQLHWLDCCSLAIMFPNHSWPSNRQPAPPLHPLFPQHPQSPQSPQNPEPGNQQTMLPCYPQTPRGAPPQRDSSARSDLLGPTRQPFPQDLSFLGVDIDSDFAKWLLGSEHPSLRGAPSSTSEQAPVSQKPKRRRPNRKKNGRKQHRRDGAIIKPHIPPVRELSLGDKVDHTQVLVPRIAMPASELVRRANAAFASSIVSTPRYHNPFSALKAPPPSVFGPTFPASQTSEPTHGGHYVKSLEQSQNPFASSQQTGTAGSQQNQPPISSSVPSSSSSLFQIFNEANRPLLASQAEPVLPSDPVNSSHDSDNVPEGDQAPQAEPVHSSGRDHEPQSASTEIGFHAHSAAEAEIPETSATQVVDAVIPEPPSESELGTTSGVLQPIAQPSPPAEESADRESLSHAPHVSSGLRDPNDDAALGFSRVNDSLLTRLRLLSGPLVQSLWR